MSTCGTGSHCERRIIPEHAPGEAISDHQSIPTATPPRTSDPGPRSIVDWQNPKPSIPTGTRARRVRIAPAEGIVPRRPMVACRGAVANVPVAALAARAKGAAGMVATPVAVVVAAACVDGDVPAASGAVAVAEGGHCDGGGGMSDLG
jgi:hypothetical protein